MEKTSLNQPMRRSKQELDLQKTAAILNRNTAGVLSLLGKDGYPYGVPLSYVYHDNKLIFHGAKSGHKLEAIAHCAKASFCVVDQDLVVPEKYTTYFRSAIAFGQVKIVTDPEAVLEKIKLLAQKYRPNSQEEMNREIQKGLQAMVIFELEIEKLTGKEAIELVNQS